jgi:hemerythrin-like domain-containing protein
MDAIDTLMNEHQQIEAILDSLEAFASRLEEGADPSPLAGYVEFLRGFADRAHHGKEEDILFALMVARGFSREAGPVAVMLHDHDEGRALVAILAKASTTGPVLQSDERNEAVRAARQYATLLRHHIYKEDSILYPMARGHLGPSDLRKLNSDCSAYDHANDTARLRELAAGLVKQFPAVVVCAESSEPVGNGCDLHCTIAACPVRNPWDEPVFPG